ncbi:basic proline-rich protein-like [Bubalus kerabau]|uniref:basic proline-rich protein-like n=1 Tax=Bubalus carabanensis TaxID=3119969 RepID=UPI00244EA100|nr:basic proline-rich protein-like [Bubalus carabanensis]
MRSRGSYRLRLQSHTEFFQNRWVVRSPRISYQGSAIVRNFVSGAGDPRSDAEPGTKRPGPREASRTPSDSSSARGRQQSRSQKLCGPRSPPGPACAGPAIHAVLTGGAPGLPGPRSGTTAQACPARPTRGGGEPKVPAAARPGRARDPAPNPGSGPGAPRPGCPSTPQAAQVGSLRPGQEPPSPDPRAPAPGPCLPRAPPAEAGATARVPGGGRPAPAQAPLFVCAARSSRRSADATARADPAGPADLRRRAPRPPAHSAPASLPPRRPRPSRLRPPRALPPPPRPPPLRPVTPPGPPRPARPPPGTHLGAHGGPARAAPGLARGSNAGAARPEGPCAGLGRAGPCRAPRGGEARLRPCAPGSE